MQRRRSAAVRGVVSVALGAWGTGSLMWFLLGPIGLLGALAPGDASTAREFIEMRFGVSVGWMLTASFMILVFMVWFVLTLATWLDRDGRMRAALAWPLGSRRLLIGGLAWMVMSGVIVIPLGVRHQDLAVGMTVAVIAAQMLLPFVAWRPALLDEAAPHRLLRLHWPGSQAVVLAGLIGLAVQILAWLADVVGGEALAIALEVPLNGIALALMLVVWFNGGHLRGIWSDIRRLSTLRVAAELLAYALIVAVLGVLAASPLFAFTAQAIFTVPQFTAMLHETGAAAPAYYAWVAWLGRHGPECAAFVGAPVLWYLALAEGRWARSHAIGRSPA